MRSFALPIAAAAVATAALPAQDRPRPSISGLVVDARGAPIDGAVVTPQVRSDAALEDRDAESTTTDANGAWSLEVDGTVVSVAVEATDYARVVVQDIHGLASWGTIALPSAGILVGRIRGADGLPLAGASVSGRRPGRRLNPVFRHHQEVRTDEDGIFRLDAVPHGPVDVYVTAEGHAAAGVLAADRTTPLDLTLERAAICAGRVLLGSGGSADCTVFARAENGFLTTATPEATGAFRLDLPPGLRYRVGASWRGTEVTAYSEILAESVDSLELDLGTPPVAERVRFDVVAAVTQRPVEAFAVHLAPSAALESLFIPGLFRGELVPGRDGTLEVPLTQPRQPGMGAARICAKGFADSLVAVPDAAEGGATVVRVALAPECTLSGRVVDAQGHPVQGARAWAMPTELGGCGYTGRPDRFAETDGDGRYTLTGLAAGQVIVQAEVEGEIPPAPVLATAALRGSAKVPDIALIARRPIEIRWQNLPRERDWVLVLTPVLQRGGRNAPTYSPPIRAYTASIDVGKPFRLDDAPIGSETIVALARRTVGSIPCELKVGLGRISAADGPRHTIDLGPAHTERVRGTLDGVEGLRPGRLVVSATAPLAQVTLAAAVGADGSFDLELPAGVHAVAVSDPVTGQVLAESKVEVPQREDSSLTIPLEVGVLRLDMRARDESTPLSLAGATARRDGARLPVHLPIGRFRMPAEFYLCAGSHVVEASRPVDALADPRDGRPNEVVVSETIEIVAGETIDLVLREPPRR